MKVAFIYKYDLFKYFPSIEETIKDKNDINIITGNRLRKEVLSIESEFSKKFNYYIDNGKLMPNELWIPFFSSLCVEKQLNVYCGLVGNLEQFKLFESYCNENQIKIEFIKYYKIKNILKVQNILEEKNPENLDFYREVLEKRITEYNSRIEQILKYVDSKYKVEYLDYFDNASNN